MANHHDTGYKELFSYPEFVQQLIEGFAPQESALSGVFSIEKASSSRENLQQAVNRIVAIIQSDPHKERLDRVITRWLKRHLQRLDAAVDLKQLNSLVEDNAMLAENLQHWAEKERLVGEQIGIEKGLKKGRDEAREETKLEIALNLISIGTLSNEQIAKASGLSLEDVETLGKSASH